MYLMNGLTLVHIVCWAGSRYRNELQIYVNINHLQPEILAYCSDGAFFTASRLPCVCRVGYFLSFYSLEITNKTKPIEARRRQKKERERDARTARKRNIDGKSNRQFFSYVHGFSMESIFA